MGENTFSPVLTLFIRGSGACRHYQGRYEMDFYPDVLQQSEQCTLPAQTIDAPIDAQTHARTSSRILIIARIGHLRFDRFADTL